MNEVIVSGSTVIVRDRNTGDITAWQYGSAEFAATVAQATSTEVYYVAK